MSKYGLMTMSKYGLTSVIIQDGAFQVVRFTHPIGISEVVGFLHKLN